MHNYSENILHNDGRTLGLRGWGYFCDQILFHRKLNFGGVFTGIHLNTWKYNVCGIKLEAKVMRLHKIRVPRRYFFCGSFMFLFCLVFAMFCARLFICALWSPAGKGLTSWLSFVVSTVTLSLSHGYPGSGVVLNCIDS